MDPGTFWMSTPAGDGPAGPGQPWRPPQWPPERPPEWPPERPPEWPPPGPARPDRTQPDQPRPDQVETVTGRGREGWLAERLFEHRMVLIHGFLDNAAATRAAAEVLTLDATASHRIRVHLDSADGDLAAALSLADTFDLLRVSVQLLAVGQVGGPSIALLTAADRVLAYPHARFHLVEPKMEVSGRADEIGIAVEHQNALLDDFIGRLCQTTGRQRDDIAADLRAGRYLSAAEAVDYGLVDALVSLEPRDSDRL